jgi:hypothetical protein
VEWSGVGWRGVELMGGTMEAVEGEEEAEDELMQRDPVIGASYRLCQVLPALRNAMPLLLHSFRPLPAMLGRHWMGKVAS